MFVLALRCFPTLPSIEGHLRAQAQVLNHDLLVALVARAGRRLRPHNHRRVNRRLASWLPRRRGDFPPPPLLAPPPERGSKDDPPRSVALSIPEGFCGGRGGKFFNRASSSLMADVQSSFVKAPLSFSFSARRRPTSPINSRTTPIRSACVRRSSESGMPVAIPSLNSHFRTVDSPTARKFAPVTQ